MIPGVELLSSKDQIGSNDYQQDRGPWYSEGQLRTGEKSPTSCFADFWDETLKRCVDVARWTRDGRDAYDGK